MWQEGSVCAINVIQVLFPSRKDAHHPLPIGNLHYVATVGSHFTAFCTYCGRLVRLVVPTPCVVEEAENEVYE